MLRTIGQFRRTLILTSVRLLLVYVLIVSFGATAYAEYVYLAWDANTEPNLAGYNIYRSTMSGVTTPVPLNGSTPIATTTFADTAAPIGTHYYIVRAVLVDGMESAPSNEVRVIIAAPTTNAVLAANAGADRTITWPATTILSAAATDDELPSGILSYSWTLVSGSGATLTAPTSGSTTASFSVAGVYTFRVTVSDGTLSASDDVIVTVNSGTQPLVAPSNLASQCSAAGDAFTVSWAPVAGANNYYLRVDYSANNANGAWYIANGVDYNLDADTKTVFTGKAIPGQLYSWWVHGATAAGAIGPSASATFTCAAASNAPLVVNAGVDRTITLPATVKLTGTATDDGKPNGTLSYSWTLVSGTDATVATPNSASTDVSFSAAGVYTFRLTVSDDALSSSDDIAISVNPNPDTTAPTVSISAPSAGASVSANTLTMSANAADNVGVVGVQFKANGVNFDVEDVAAPYSVTSNIRRWTAGTYVLEAVARDAVGNRTTSLPVSIEVGKLSGNSLQLRTSSGNAWVTDSASDTVTTGYAETEVGAATESVALISLKSGGDVVSETSVQGTIPVSQGRLYVRVNEQINTGLAIVNDDIQPALISFYFTNAAGNEVGHGTFTVEAKHNMAVFVNQAPFNLSMFMEGTLTFTSSRPVAVTALQSLTNERREFLMTTLPIGTVGSSTVGQSIVLPQFAEGGGWSSQIVLMNPFDTTLTGTVHFFSGASSKQSTSPVMIMVNGVMDSQFTYTIPPRAAIRLDTSNSTAQVRTGYVVVTTSGNTAVPQGLAIVAFADGPATVSQAGVPALTAATAFHSYVELDANVRSGLAIANSSAEAARITLTLEPSDPFVMSFTASLEIPAGGHISSYVDELMPGTPPAFQGVVWITSAAPVAVTGLRVRTNNQGRVVVSGIPVVNDSTVETISSSRVFPIVVTGGGYSTSFIGLQ